MKKILKLGALLLVLAVWIAGAAYGYKLTHTSSNGLTKIVIGYQAGDPIDISKTRGVLKKKMAEVGYDVTFKEFTDGAAEMQALESGSIDYARTGDTPPVTAQAAGANLAYIAVGASKSQGSAILVSASSGISSVADLKGKTVAYTSGTSSQYLLLEALEKNGLSASDVKWVDMKQSNALLAFEKGKVDAWVTWDPYTAEGESLAGGKILTTGEGLSNNRDFLISTQTFASKNTTASKYLLKYLSADMTWANSHKSEVVTLLTKSLKLDESIVKEMVDRRTFSWSTVSDSVFKEQQGIADAFYDADIIKKQITVTDEKVSD